jgi:hypothetical protein
MSSTPRSEARRDWTVALYVGVVMQWNEGEHAYSTRTMPDSDPASAAFPQLAERNRNRRMPMSPFDFHLIKRKALTRNMGNIWQNLCEPDSMIDDRAPP